MAAAAARFTEAQAQVVKSQNEKDIAVLNLAAKDEQFRAKVAADVEISRQRNETQVFLAGMANTAKTRDQMLVQEELKVKKEKGTGI